MKQLLRFWDYNSAQCNSEFEMIDFWGVILFVSGVSWLWLLQIRGLNLPTILFKEFCSSWQLVPDVPSLWSALGRRLNGSSAEMGRSYSFQWHQNLKADMNAIFITVQRNNAASSASIVIGTTFLHFRKSIWSFVKRACNVRLLGQRLFCLHFHYSCVSPPLKSLRCFWEHFPVPEIKGWGRKYWWTEGKRAPAKTKGRLNSGLQRQAQRKAIFLSLICLSGSNSCYCLIEFTLFHNNITYNRSGSTLQMGMSVLFQVFAWSQQMTAVVICGSYLLYGFLLSSTSNYRH